jgi:hypothetical protein
VNPAVFGTSIARSGEITAKNDVIEQSNFSDYLVARWVSAIYRFRAIRLLHGAC